MIKLEEALSIQMRAVGLPVFEREYKFHPDRKWRFDFYLEGWGIEVQGGGWVNGGHNRNALTMTKDYEKYNTAQRLFNSNEYLNNFKSSMCRDYETR